MAEKTLTPENFSAIAAKDKAARARSRLLVGGLLALALLEGFALWQLIPLKERVPYFVEVERATGRVVASEQVARSFSPDEANRRYFLKEWAQSLLTIDPVRSKSDLLPRARAMVRSKAVEQFDAWIERDQTLKRLVERPDLSRAAEVVSISFVPGAENVAMIRLVLTTRSKYDSAVQDGKVLTVHYALVPPQTDEEILRNPIGLVITDFAIDNEVVK